MALREPHNHDHAEHGVVASNDALRMRAALAQALMMGMGIFFIVTGAVGLARGDFSAFTSEAVHVGVWQMTPLLAMIHLALGVIMLGGATGPGSARAVGYVLGPLLIALGIIALIQAVDAFGWNDADGVTYLVTGALALLAAIIAPALVARSVDVIDI